MSAETVSAAEREMDFDGLRISFDSRIIEPRPWTAAQSHWASELLADLPPGAVLEVCSGAGHIGLLAIAEHARELTQVDLDPVACEYAVRNARRAGMADRVHVRCGPMDEVLDAGETFPLVIADPPYLPTTSVARYPEDPVVAIDGGPDGFDLVAACLQVIGTHLAPAGAAILQVADLAQVAAVRRHLDAHPELGLEQVDARDCGRGALIRLGRGPCSTS
ncbi:methyltransferase domain-containing protein [Nocardioides sp.]|uniref:methyltransferase domain-containing protein n=1 Tax=Nocardioides sp. TaxID=35761 RepID=UPI003D0D4F14